LGTTVDRQSRVETAVEVLGQLNDNITFVSCEPLMEEVTFPEMPFDWLIIGGRTGTSGMAAGQPEWEWVWRLQDSARRYGVETYWKPNLKVRPKGFPTGIEAKRGPNPTMFDQGATTSDSAATFH